MKNKITDDHIKEMWEKVSAGETVQAVTNEAKISREWYYKKCEEIGLKTQKKLQENKDKNEITEISNMHDLAILLDTDYDTVHIYSNPNKSSLANSKRMNYLKNHSPKKFQEAIMTTIINYYKLSPIDIIKMIQNKQ